MIRVEDGKDLKSFEGHTHHVLAVDWSGDGKQLVTGGADNVLKVWDFETGEQLRTLSAGRQAGHGRPLGPGQAAGGGGLGRLEVRYWNPNGNGNVVRTFAGPGDYVFGVATSNDGKLVAAGGADGVLFLWNGDDAKVIRKVEPRRGDRERPAGTAPTAGLEPGASRMLAKGPATADRTMGGGASARRPSSGCRVSAPWIRIRHPDTARVGRRILAPRARVRPRLPSAPFREEGKTHVAATVEQLAALVRGRLEGDGSVPINSARPVGEAGPGDITFIESERYAKLLKASPASAAIVGPHFKAAGQARDAGDRGRRPDHRLPRRPDPPGRRRQAPMDRRPPDGRRGRLGRARRGRRRPCLRRRSARTSRSATARPSTPAP